MVARDRFSPTPRPPGRALSRLEHVRAQPLHDHDPPTVLEHGAHDAALPSDAGATPLEEQTRQPAVAVGHPARLDRRRLDGRGRAVHPLVERGPLPLAPHAASHAAWYRTCVRTMDPGREPVSGAWPSSSGQVLAPRRLAAPGWRTPDPRTHAARRVPSSNAPPYVQAPNASVRKPWQAPGRERRGR